jgi:hypothetical protein
LSFKSAEELIKQLIIPHFTGETTAAMIGVSPSTKLTLGLSFLWTVQDETVFSFKLWVSSGKFFTLYQTRKKRFKGPTFPSMMFLDFLFAIVKGNARGRLPYSIYTIENCHIKMSRML